MRMKFGVASVGWIDVDEMSRLPNMSMTLESTVVDPDMVYLANDEIPAAPEIFECGDRLTQLLIEKGHA